MSFDNQDMNGKNTASEDYADSPAGADEGLVMTEEKQPVNRSTLMLFAVLVVAAGGMYFMYHRAGPSAANASITQESADARKTISEFLNSSDPGFRTMEQRLKNTEKVVQQFLVYPSATQVPLSELQTNPFRQHQQQLVTNRPDPALSETALRKKQEEERLAAKKAAESLSLQSIIHSDTRKGCMINSRLFREGENVDNFVIEKISPTTVLVKTGIYRFELRMQ